MSERLDATVESTFTSFPSLLSEEIISVNVLTKLVSSQSDRLRR